MIFDHDSYPYKVQWETMGNGRFNGAYYYSKEIVSNIIPDISTDRNWMTVNYEGMGADHSIVFIHNNLHPENYDWLKRYDDLVLVCGIEATCDKVAHLGTPVYLPLSVDVAYVEKFRQPYKDRTTAYVGRLGKRSGTSYDPFVDQIGGMERDSLLKMMAMYRNVYAVGRTAIEARILGCNILPFDPRYPDPDIWKVVDNSEAAVMLQGLLDSIDGR